MDFSQDVLDLNPSLAKLSKAKRAQCVRVGASILGKPAFRSYGWNRGTESRKLAIHVSPSQDVMFADSAQSGQPGNGNIAWLTHNWANVNADNNCCNSGPGSEGIALFHPHHISDIHNNGANISFWDGHVKWMNAQSIPSGRHGNGIKFVAEDPAQ